MKFSFFISIILFPIISFSQQTVTSDKDWSKRATTIIKSMEADFIIRLGDVDNLGFGWPEDFDPFCGRMTQAHEYPWVADPNEMDGFDRILLSSKYKPGVAAGCDAHDGYSDSYDANKTKPVEFTIDVSALDTVTIKNAFIQFFIDDFQAPSMCSKFQITLNGKRYTEAERFFNAIDQTGPVGKLITIPIPEEFWPDLKALKLKIKVDEMLGTGDGFALDFIRILINRKRENTCRGDISGIVLDKETQEPIANAIVWTTENIQVKTDSEGRFQIKGIPTGLEIVSASKAGYLDNNVATDVAESDNWEFQIFLEKSISADFGGKLITAGESVTLSNILFDQGKAELRAESKTELDKIVKFMQANDKSEIELSGHTSSEGDASVNRSLSYKRVKACKDYIVSKGIDAGRITTIGHGPDKPVAKNDTEENRAKNRRVEMRVLKL